MSCKYLLKTTTKKYKALIENISLGQPYSEIKKVISINIVYFDLGQGKDYIYKGKTNIFF